MAAAAGRGTFPGQPHHRRPLGQPLPAAGRGRLQDRSSRPLHSPRRTPAALEQQVVRLRSEHRSGPARLAARTGIAARCRASCREPAKDPQDTA